MRILQTGDLHLSNRGIIAGRYVLRDGVNLCLWDKIRALKTICEYVETEVVDLVVVAGDVFDHPNPENVTIKVAVETIERFAEYAPVVIIPGNHDGKAAIANALSIFGKSQRRDGIYVSHRPEIIPIVSKQTEIQVFTLPYPRKISLHTDPQYKTLSPEETSQLISRKMEEIVLGFHANVDRGKVNVLVGHLSIGGSFYSKEQVVPPFDISIRKEVLDKFDLALFGHLHAPQPYYCGAISRGGFGDEDVKVGFKVYEVQEDGHIGWTRIDETFVEVPARSYVTIPAERILGNGIESINPETAIRVKGRVVRNQYDEIVRRIKALGLPYIKNDVEIETEIVRSETGEMSQEPSLEEAIRIWGQGRDGVNMFIDKLVETAKEIEHLHAVGEEGKTR